MKTNIGTALVWLGAALIFSAGCARQENAGKFPEELVQARANDDIVNAGALFAATTNAARPVAVIWIHGEGANFYEPAYVSIGRALANHGYTCITANTRMHDLANVLGEREGKRIRGGGCWGVASDAARDVGAWIDFAEERGFARVVLVGHREGWSSVRSYQAQRQDPRVVGMVLASGPLRPDMRPPDLDQFKLATRMIENGKGDDLVRISDRPDPSVVSAATFLDLVNTPPQFRDFFGVQVTNPGITRVHCPLLAFFGTKEVGTAEDLEWLKSRIAHHGSGPCRVDTSMIQGAEHMYVGQEEQVAQVISQWADTALPSSRGSDGAPLNFALLPGRSLLGNADASSH